MSSEVGSGHVAILPIFKGFRSKVRQEVEGAEKDASAGFRRGFTKSTAETASVAGRGFKRAFSSASVGLADAPLKKLNADVAVSARALSAARLKEQDAAGRARVAEVQLGEARAKYAAGSSQVVRAEERLESATRALGAAQGVTSGASAKLAAAQSRLAAASESAASATGRAGGGIRGVFAGLGGVVSQVSSSIASGFSRAMESVKQVASDAAQVAKNAFMVTGAAIAAVMGTALVGGFNRLKGIETATARMRGLGFATEEVAQAMDIADKAAQGTAFSMDELAGAASMAMTAGIKPGEELVKYLEAIKGASTASGASVAEIGSVFGKVRTSGRAYTQEINQLADRQIPIWKALSDEIGVSSDEVRKLASDGKITAEVFEEAVRASTGGMAAAMAETTDTSLTNMRAALKRFGVALMGSKLDGDQIVGSCRG